LPVSHTDLKTIGRVSCPFYAAFRIVVQAFSTQLSDAQIMINMALDFANLEGCELQPMKSVAIHIRGNNKQCETTNEKLNMGNITMPYWSYVCFVDV
jgi:hypothetical protein